METSAQPTWVASWRAEWYGRDMRVIYEEKEGIAEGLCPSRREGDGNEGKCCYRARVARSVKCFEKYSLVRERLTKVIGTVRSRLPLSVLAG